MDSVATYSINTTANNGAMKDISTPSTPVMTQPPLKLVFVGDPCVGKTCLLYSYQKGTYHDNELCHTSVLEGFTKSVVVNGSEYICLLWDTIGSNDFEKLRPLSYPKTDCFVICYALNNRSSLKNTQTKWIPEIRQHEPEVPFIIVGTKQDLRETSQAPDLITPEQVQTLHETAESAACEFMECSAKDLPSIENVCRVAVRVTLEHQQKKRAQAAANSQSLCVIS